MKIRSEAWVRDKTVRNEFSSKSLEVSFLLSLSEVEHGEAILGGKRVNDGIVRDELGFPNRVGLIKQNTSIIFKHTVTLSLPKYPRSKSPFDISCACNGKANNISTLLLF